MMGEEEEGSPYLRETGSRSFSYYVSQHPNECISAEVNWLKTKKGMKDYLKHGGAEVCPNFKGSSSPKKLNALSAPPTNPSVLFEYKLGLHEIS